MALLNIPKTPLTAALAFLLIPSPILASETQGFTVSQGDIEHHADTARARFGVDGSGVKVGVLAPSYNCNTDPDLLNPGQFVDAAASIATGDLPPDVEVLKDWQQCMTGDRYLTDEGRAMLEVIHDLAPGAKLVFHTSGTTEQDLAAGIRALADAGATVIVDNGPALTEPVYQEGGPVADAVREVISRGISYISATGNLGKQVYEASFNPSGIQKTIENRDVELHDFDTGPGIDTCQQVNLRTDGRSGNALVLHWNEPLNAAETDLDIFLMDDTCTYVVSRYQPFSAGKPTVSAVGTEDNVGATPVEQIRLTIDDTEEEVTVGSTSSFGIIIGRHSGIHTPLFRITNADMAQPDEVLSDVESRTAESMEYGTNVPVLYGHGNLPEVITVGAVAARVRYVPEAHTRTLIDTQQMPVEYFSSLGGTSLYYDAFDNLLSAPQIRMKPDIAGVDFVQNRFYGEYSFSVAWGEPRQSVYIGTSAAAAHIAGIVVLARQAAPGATPAQIADALRNSATSLTSKGYDQATGYGLADAENLIANLQNKQTIARPDPATATSSAAQSILNDQNFGCPNPTAIVLSNNIFKGTSGNDIIRGSTGNEVIKGKKGNDILCGGPGNDKLNGGPGADTFIYVGSNTGQDKIADYEKHNDIIEIIGRSYTVSDTNQGALISFDDGSNDSILIVGVKARKLSIRTS